LYAIHNSGVYGYSEGVMTLIISRIQKLTASSSDLVFPNSEHI